MNYPKSTFGKKLTARTGTLELMDDLGHAMSEGRGRMLMMGGGNPGHIPDVQKLWRGRLAALAADAPLVDAILGDYDVPAGSSRFRDALADLLRSEYGWPVTAGNIGITNGGQTAFFFLFNLLAGRFDDGSRRHILLPLVPEYIGYADQSVAAPLFRAHRPSIESIGNRHFKYHVDFEALHIDSETAAICVSRPTNPSSNVLTDGEIRRLSVLADEARIPLIIDNAYGVPFPGVVFSNATPVWDQHIILTLSLSKLGLPGTRTGIVVAHENVIADLAAINAVVGLANNNLGQAIALPFIESGEILAISENLIRPFYLEKSRLAEELVHKHLPAGLPWRLHRRDGAFFLWLWFDDLPVTTRELYRRLKQRQALVIPGEYFFYGLDHTRLADWPHARQCIRLSYTQSEDTLDRGIRILGEELAEAYASR